MAVIGNVSSADFQPPGDMTDLARPPDDYDRGDLGRRPVYVRPGERVGTGRRGRRRSRRKARK